MILKRVLRFGITGVLNTIVHIATASVWINSVHPNPAGANGVAFTVATLFSYTMNTWWTFATTIKRRTLVRFIVVALIGLALSAGIAGIVDWLGYSYAYGIAAVVCTMPPVNFLLHHFWTYRHDRSSQPTEEERNHE